MAHSQTAKAASPSTSGSSRADSSKTSTSPRLGRRSLVIPPPEITSSAVSSSAVSLDNYNNTTNTTTTLHRDSLNASPYASKRSSFAESFTLRGYPSSPRAQRTLSSSGSALTDLLMHPPLKTNGEESRFKGRDWRTIQVSEIIDSTETRFVELDTSIEDTTKLLVRSGAPNVVLIRKSRNSKAVTDTFDYNDLNAYLLLVLGLSQPDGAAKSIAERTRAGDVIPVGEVTNHLGVRGDPAFIHDTASLDQAMEILGSGHHRVLLCKEGTNEAVGVLSQLRLVRFFWDNHQNFVTTESLYSRSLKELELGAKEVLAINGDRPLADALRLMHDEGITSLPVLDSQRNVVGNISHVDVRLLTDTSAIPLLSSTCIHFISVILNERGLYDGQDSFPVFHVTYYATLAHTVAKLCATRSHRMWIVDAPSPNTSVPPSPGIHQVVPPFTIQNSTSLPASLTSTPNRQRSGSEMTPGPPYTSTHPSISVTAGQLPGQSMSGRLSGVVSLTDVLNLFARASGLSPRNPEERRSRRRQSSSSSMRASIEGARSTAADLSRSPSTSSRRGQTSR